MIQLEEKLYTSTEVADILGVSLRSVYRYLEEGKIDAEVKTATGRHRFSRKNILDFLYPNGGIQEESKVEKEKPEPKVVTSKKKVKEEPVVIEEPLPVEETPVEEVQPEPAVEEEPIDWLAKFREAAQKYREEAAQTTRPAVDSSTMSMADTVKEPEVDSFVQQPAPEVKKKKEAARNFYRSNLGGLKEIAQNIDKGSRNSYLDYAFTLNAGLSLFKPIKPFSVLHAYVKEEDLTFFEKLLGLTPADESNAQLCLVLTSDDAIYKNREEMHGLYVVEKKKLLEDIQKFGDSTLVSEASSILK